jgi:hypothetical protein
MGQGKKIHKAFKLLMEDEVAFQTFIKEEFENHNIIFNDSLGEVIERAMAKRNKAQGVKVPEKGKLIMLFLEHFRMKPTINSAATAVAESDFFDLWRKKYNYKMPKDKSDSYGKTIPGEVTFMYNLASNHFAKELGGGVESIKKWLALIDSDKFKDECEDWELGFHPNEDIDPEDRD